MGTDDITALDPPAWARREIESERPQYEVHITRGYWIDKYEVTNAAFQAFAEDGGYREKDHWSKDGLAWLSIKDLDDLPRACTHEAAPDHPRVCVTGYEAEAYAHWRGGRLPTDSISRSSHRISNRHTRRAIELLYI